MPVTVTTLAGRRLTYAAATKIKVRGNAVLVYGQAGGNLYAVGPDELLAVVSVAAVERVDRIDPVPEQAPTV